MRARERLPPRPSVSPVLAVANPAGRKAGRKGTEIKVYLVVQISNVAEGDEPNRMVIATKLTHAAAQSIVDRVPGTYIQKMVADK